MLFSDDFIHFWLLKLVTCEHMTALEWMKNQRCTGRFDLPNVNAGPKCMRFANHCTLFLFTVHTVSGLFWIWGCKTLIPYLKYIYSIIIKLGCPSDKMAWFNNPSVLYRILQIFCVNGIHAVAVQLNLHEICLSKPMSCWRMIFKAPSDRIQT